MAKFILLFFLSTGSGLYYLTYNGIGQAKVETLNKQPTIRSNSSRSNGSSYNSSGYNYGK